MDKLPTDVLTAAAWVKRERLTRAWSTTELANRARGIALEEGSQIGLKQQSISTFEQGRAKRVPEWLRYVRKAFDASDDGTSEDVHLTLGLEDSAVMVERLPTYVGVGGGGTGDGDSGTLAISQNLVEFELRAHPSDLLAIVVEGNSMEPDFHSGDQLLVDKRRQTLAQPGAFCLWEGDGYVVKYIERIPGTEPAKVLVISRNGIYPPRERLVEEIDVRGRVVWCARRV